tara:strand:- start:14218 stop:15060 length:843 start_codon:yes stop_codon:yes gene_type:complete
MTWRLHFTHTGYCTSNRADVLQGEKREKIRFYATIGILVHPNHGLVLFDVGYHDQFYEQTKTFPYSIYSKITPVFHSPEENAKSRLEALGYSAEDVSIVVVSHFHADHIAGLIDFPNAKFICDSNAWRSIRSKRGIWAVKRGFIPALLPADFEHRLELIDFEKSTAVKHHKILKREYDLFNDGSFMISELPGHASGQIGARIQINSGEVFLIADAAWVRENYIEMKLPSQIVKLFFSSWVEFKKSLERVHRYHNEHPSTVVIPCHCFSTLMELNRDSVEL